MEDNYVAWVHFHNGSISTCDSDSPGAFKVYRHPQSFQRIREIFAQRHPIESLFFEQWLKEQCNFATQTKEGKESGDRQSD